MKRILFSLCTAGILLLAALLPASAQTAESSLKIGIFADADSLPLLLCETEGLFRAAGAEVTLVRFQSAMERDAAFQAGTLDGIISDILATLLAVQAGFPVFITSLTDGRYGIAASPSSGARTLSDLAGKTVGISSNTVIHYMVDSFLGKNIPAAQLVPIPKMPVRLEMLLSGQLTAAGMPEPFLTTAMTRGAVLLATTDDYGLGAGVLVFSGRALANRNEQIASFYRAYWTAAQKINADPDRYRGLLMEKLGFSKEASEAYKFVVYKKPRLPSVQDVADASTWLKSKGLLKMDIPAERIFDGRATSQF